jgi:hypothetical protein
MSLKRILSIFFSGCFCFQVCFAQPATADSFTGNFLEGVIDMTEIGKSNAKKETISLVKELQENGYAIHTGKDADLRPGYVGAQAEIERQMAYLLNNKEIVRLVGVIHTPTPATPLCTKGEISSGLVDQSLSKDDKRLFTVMERASVVREYLNKGGILYVVYPEGGREKRTLAQLEIYDAERMKYPHSLVDQVLDCSQLDREMVGATYFFKTLKGGTFAFGIMAPQVNAPNDDQEWGIWFGSIQHPKVKQRVDSVLQYLADFNGPDPHSNL